MDRRRCIEDGGVADGGVADGGVADGGVDEDEVDDAPRGRSVLTDVAAEWIRRRVARLSGE